jgi:hypothetical protein
MRHWPTLVHPQYFSSPLHRFERPAERVGRRHNSTHVTRGAGAFALAYVKGHHLSRLNPLLNGAASFVARHHPLWKECNVNSRSIETERRERTFVGVAIAYMQHSAPAYLHDEAEVFNGAVSLTAMRYA